MNLRENDTKKNGVNDYFRISERGYMKIPVTYIKSDAKKLWAYAYTMTCRLALGRDIHRVSFHDYIMFMFTEAERKRMNVHDEYEYFHDFYVSEFNTDIGRNDVVYITDHKWKGYMNDRYAIIFFDELMKIADENKSSRKKLFKVLCIYRLKMNTRDYNMNGIDDITSNPRYLSCYHSDFVKFKNMEIKSRQTIDRMLDRLEEMDIIKQYRDKAYRENGTGKIYTPPLFITDCYERAEMEFKSAIKMETESKMGAIK